MEVLYLWNNCFGSYPTVRKRRKGLKKRMPLKMSQLCQRKTSWGVSETNEINKRIRLILIECVLGLHTATVALLQ